MKRALTIWTFLCLLITLAFATTVGPNSPTTGDEIDTGNTAWNTTSRIVSSNNQYATCGLGSGDGSNDLRAVVFSFGIDDAATVDGVTVEIEKKASAGSALEDVGVWLQLPDFSLSADNNSAAGFWGTSDAYSTHGGATDTWGETLTGADVNSDDFGVLLRVIASGGVATASVDHVRMTIDYTLPSGSRKRIVGYALIYN